MRRRDREIVNIDDILSIVEKAKILHLGLFDDGYPYVVPLHYGYEYENDNLIFFLHCALEGHKLDLIKSNPNVCVELECDVELISGGDIPCKYGSAYASVIGFGHAEIINDEKDKIKGLILLMKNQTGKSFEINEKMVSAVSVIKVVVSAFTAKARRIT